MLRYNCGFKVEMKTQFPIQTIDLNFSGRTGTIAAYMLQHGSGIVLIECGPGSTLPALKLGLAKYGYRVEDITDIFLTHIHLDHAGSAGWLARQGARVYVHPVGAPHLLDPEKLLSSAKRIYGEEMDTMWGDFLPVPEEKIEILQDNQVVEIGGLCVRAIDTQGHANHHVTYLLQDTCFSGDIGGVRLAGSTHLRLPMPPPEFNLELWRRSIDRLTQEFNRGAFNSIAPTHFGIFPDAGNHLASMQQALDEIEAWIENNLPGDPPLELLNERLLAWTKEGAIQQGLDESQIEMYEIANPTWMSMQGIRRYWKKVRMGE